MLTAMLAARQQVVGQDIWEDGVGKNLAMMVSAESHYSVERSARIMGLGSDGLIRLPVKNHLIDVDQLPALLEKKPKPKAKPLFR